MTRSVGSRGVLGGALLGLLALGLALAIAPRTASAATAESLRTLATDGQVGRMVGAVDEAGRLAEVADTLPVRLGDALVEDDVEDAETPSVEPQATGNRAIVYANFYYDQAFEVLRLMNAERAKAGVPPLHMDESLLDTAMLRATETAILFSHTRPDGSRCFTANPLMGAENIAVGPSSAASVMQRWMSSDGHRGNILSPSYRTVGVGCIVHGGVPFWSQCFGAGSDSSDCAQPANDVGRIETSLTTEEIRDGGDTYRLDPKLDAPTSLSLGIGEERLLSFTQVNPAFGLAKARIVGEGWTSSDPSVATADYGLATGVREGTALLTCDLSGFRYRVDVRVKNGAPVYRLYNRWTHEHLYTTDARERETDVELGWTDEGVAWYAPRTSGVNVYRLYNPNNGDHHYTTNRGEYDELVRCGWRGENAKFLGADASGLPIYRVFDPHNLGAGAHHYTADGNERATLVNAGWRDEQIGWYGVR